MLLPSGFDVNLGGDKSKPVVVRLTIGENVLYLGLALVMVLAFKVKKGR